MTKFKVKVVFKSKNVNKEKFFHFEKLLTSCLSIECLLQVLTSIQLSFKSLLATDSNGKSKQEIERNIDGNICRCTGMLISFIMILTIVPDLTVKFV